MAMKGVVIDFDRKSITIVPIDDDVIETSEWQDSIENIDYYLQKKVGCRSRVKWGDRFSFFVLEDNEKLKIDVKI